MRIAYNILIHALAAAGLTVLLPAVLMSEKRRKTAVYRLGLRLPETAAAAPASRPYWVHALSVGEVLAAIPLIQGLRRRRPGRPVVLSASTLSGFALARRRAAALTDGLYYFPYDLPFSVRRVAAAVSPKMVLLVETDLWPNFLFQAASKQVPVIMVNARLSERSLRGYRRIRPLVLPMLRSCARICTQSAEESDRFAALGVCRQRLSATGNLKFDQGGPLPEEGPAETASSSIRAFCGGPVLVAGSTHPGEEKILAGAFAELKAEFPGLHLVVAPRDPSRAPAVRRLLVQAGTGAACLGEIEKGSRRPAEATVVDRIGLLRSLYGIADVAYVGGSLAPFGGHNPLEPAAHARPVVFGNDMSDFREIAGLLVAAGGAVQVDRPAALAGVLRSLFSDPAAAAAAGRRAHALISVHRGAVDRTLDVVDAVEKAAAPTR